MNPQIDPVHLPRAARWLVSLFPSTDEAESIVGDLAEEFSQIESVSGASVARRWYWRQTVKTIPALFVAGIRAAPLRVVTIAIGGFLFRWLFSWWSNPTINRATESLLERFEVYEHGPSLYLFYLTHALLLERLVVNMLIGMLVALFTKDREMTSTVLLAVLSDVLAVQAVWMGVARTGDEGLLWTLPWSFTFSIAVVMGGVVVRAARSHELRRHATR